MHGVSDHTYAQKPWSFGGINLRKVLLFRSVGNHQVCVPDPGGEVGLPFRSFAEHDQKRFVEDELASSGSIVVTSVLADDLGF